MKNPHKMLYFSVKIIIIFPYATIDYKLINLIKNWGKRQCCSNLIYMLSAQLLSQLVRNSTVKN